MTARLFGTDGFRGPYDPTKTTGHINSITFEGLAFAYASIIADRDGAQPTFVVGGDTRTSTPELLHAVCRGAAAAGAEIWNVGVAPTPMIAWIAKIHGINAIAITASHNPDSDNGFKPFEKGGVKPTREILDEIEARYWHDGSSSKLLPQNVGRIVARPELAAAYLDGLINMLGNPNALQNKLIVLDGANGAVSTIAPNLYRRLGAEVVTISCDPEGTINKNCGAAHLEGLRTFLAEHPELTGDPRFLGGFANDGDGDRVMGIDARGRVVNGNHWMRYLAKGQKGIVGTTYTNSALREAIEADGVTFHECDNGDSYVTAKLLELGLARGGEATGHLIDLSHIPSGDGIYMGGWLATTLADQKHTLSDAYDSLELWPELLKNVRVDGADGKTIARSDEIQKAIAEELERFPHAVRVILRPSGTEPLVRVWAEARQQDIVEAVVDRLSATVQTLASTPQA